MIFCAFLNTRKILFFNIFYRAFKNFILKNYHSHQFPLILVSVCEQNTYMNITIKTNDLMLFSTICIQIHTLNAFRLIWQKCEWENELSPHAVACQEYSRYTRWFNQLYQRLMLKKKLENERFSVLVSSTIFHHLHPTHMFLVNKVPNYENCRTVTHRCIASW